MRRPTVTDPGLWHLMFSSCKSQGSSFALRDGGGNMVFTSNCVQTGACTDMFDPNRNADVYLATGNYSLSMTTINDMMYTSSQMFVQLTTPIPAALPLFASGLAALAIGRKRKIRK